jgi:hypothetical protein
MQNRGLLSALVVSTSLAFVGCGNDDGRTSPTPDQATPGYSLSGGKATPDFEGPGAAGVCADDPQEIVHVVFESDVPQPRCAFVRGSQRLSVANNLESSVVARLGRAELLLPAGSTVTLSEPFSDYLEPGGYTMTTDLYDGNTYSVEIRYEGDLG